jgi:hypothetical protein
MRERASGILEISGLDAARKIEVNLVARIAPE